MTAALPFRLPFAPNAGRPAARRDPDQSLLAMVLGAGGDERIALDAQGRNPYGAPIRPAPDEIWFASSTASPISQRGWDAAAAKLDRAFNAAKTESWFAELRARLLTLFGAPAAEVVFCASGTQAELAALALARSLDGGTRPLVNLVTAPEETGRGVPLAAGGRHFLGSAPFGATIKGRPVAGWGGDIEINVETLPIRDAFGAPLAPDETDARGEAKVRAIVASGARALVHVLDCSKTGLSGFSRQSAAALRQKFPDQVSVVVDACQLRCAPSQIRADLEAGFLVMITGSKFAGGPAFSGALLAPEGFAARLDKIDWPEGLAAHGSALDWPPALRAKIAGPFGARANEGLGLRWEAALAELEIFYALDVGLRARAKWLFAQAVRAGVAATPGLSLDSWRHDAPRTIFPIFSRDARASAAKLKSRLREKGLHVGQPVRIGGAEALRVCLAVPQINDFAARLGAGANEAQAFQPLAADLARLFAEWGRLVTAS
jgi:hypothetical protein